jgi:hypothetical protein
MPRQDVLRWPAKLEKKSGSKPLARYSACWARFASGLGFHYAARLGRAAFLAAFAASSAADLCAGPPDSLVRDRGARQRGDVVAWVFLDLVCHGLDPSVAVVR